MSAENWPFYISAIAVCITVASLFPPMLRQPHCMARRIASVIRSGFIRSSVDHFTSATLRRFHRRLLLHATDFFQVVGFTVRGGVSVMAEKSRNSPNKTEDQPLVRPPIFPGYG
jgi:hypothetical protein